MNIKQRLFRLRIFYINATIYLSTFLLATILWLSMGMGPFWPMWLLMGFAVALSLEYYRIESIEWLKKILPFLDENWEEKKLEKIFQSSHEKSVTEKESVEEVK